MSSEPKTEMDEAPPIDRRIANLATKGPTKLKGQKRRVTVNALLKEAILIATHRAGMRIKERATGEFDGNIIDYFEWLSLNHPAAQAGLLKVIFQHDVEVAQRTVAPTLINVEIGEDASPLRHPHEEEDEDLDA